MPDTMRQEILTVITASPVPVTWGDIMDHVEPLFPVKNWLTEVRGPLQGLINDRLIERCGGVHTEQYRLVAANTMADFTRRYDEFNARFAGRVTLKNFKHNARLSEETECFSATVYVDGVRMAEATNRGHGGATMVHRLPTLSAKSRAAWNAFTIEAKKVGRDFDIREAMGTLVDEAVTVALNAKEDQRFRRMCKTTILFRNEGDEADRWRTVKWPSLAAIWTPKARATFLAFGVQKGWFTAAPAVILNDTVAGL
jgi:hypothetical protein